MACNDALQCSGEFALIFRADIRERDLPAFAAEERDFQQSFERRHLPAYRALSERQFVCGAREAEMPGGRFEGHQQRH